MATTTQPRTSPLHALPRRAAAEAIGTAFLLAGVVGSGIAAERLAGGNVALALLANAVATAAALVALICALAPVSGAHFNPAVTLLAWARGQLPGRDAAWFVVAQIGGAIAGVAAAHAMFGLELLGASTHARAGGAQLWSELVATSGLLLVVQGCSRHPLPIGALAVAGYVAAGYWFTASTCFANPAVTIARSLTDTFAGIRPADVPGFLLAQAIATALVAAATRLLAPSGSAARSEAT